MTTAITTNSKGQQSASNDKTDNHCHFHRLTRTTDCHVWPALLYIRSRSTAHICYLAVDASSPRTEIPRPVL
ncbi:hypothetical protein E2C01_032238 [Portunus trituberculatus]|uniref:Uncharacterized protein n=1 Tax=Portunus trituberculatus TaxID=210409 RepID=A0A5B7F028_PORTR|nr:hypothetical protein [Portunus trituberculatus]